MHDGHINRAPIWDDIQTLTGIMLPAIDIVFGGFPCQDISIAGNGVGLAGERSGLFFEIMRLAEEIKPTFLFLENVPAIRTRGLDRVGHELADRGYDSRWCALSAGQVGAPHRRQRWFLLAYAPRARCKVAGHQHRTPIASPRPTFVDRVQTTFWDEAASDIHGMDDGVSPKTHRLKCLGNAVVPLQAREAFMKLAGIKEFKL